MYKMEVGKLYTEEDEEDEDEEEGEEEEEDEDKEDDYLLQRNILLRNYQERLFEVAKNGNTIIYLPTGAGKTLIAVYVLCSRSNEIRRRFTEGGKRAFFACTTKVLVYQVAKVLRISTKFNVACFTGDMNVDTWSRETWLTAFEENHVLVLTGEILKQLLELKMINPEKISLVVFDECHHAVAEHPYRLALELLTAVEPPDAPLLLGLTAVLLNSNPKSDGVSPIIKALESAFKGKVVTEVNLQEALSFSANPTDKIIEYEEDRKTPLTEKIIYFYEAIIGVFSNMVLHVDEGVSIPEGGYAFKERNRAKRIRNAFVQSKEHFEEFGVSCGLLSALFYIIYFEKQRLLSKDKVEIQSLIYAKTELNKIRKATYKVIGEEETFDSLFRYSSSKVQKLIRLIRENIEKTNGKLLSTIVFVRQRAAAIILAYLFKLLSAADKSFSCVKADFIVGSSILNKETSLLLSKTEGVLKQFASGTLNLLFSTNILEEGIDISACNCVISFDFPVSYSSYFQARGRARDKLSTYYVFLKKSEANDKTSELSRFRNLEKVIQKTIFEEDDAAECEQQGDEGKVDQKICIPGKSGNIEINGITAIKAVFRYCGSLPQDKHALLSPSAWYENCSGKKKGFVRLPMNCPLREIVEGEPCVNKREAKRSAFLAVVKRLYEIGELDECLNHRSFAMREENFDDLFPHYRKETVDKNLAQPGTRKRKQIYKMKYGESLSDCLPVPGVKAYLHIIDLTLAFGSPELQRKKYIYDTLRNPVTFALITKKKLFKIFQFPLFLDMGQIDCDLLVNYDEITLTEPEFHDIKACHFALFKGVTRVLKTCQVFDSESKEFSFLVAPVEKNEEGRFVLNWDLIRCDFCKGSKSALVRYNPTKDRNLKRNWECLCQTESDATSSSLIPLKINGKFLWTRDLEEQRREPQFAMTEADYKYFIIVPNYRKQDPPQYYIVNKFCHDLSPLSPFSAKYVDYVSYYKEKYEIDITNMKQPLLRVSALYNCCNFNKPRDRKARRAREKYTEYEELLIPELCDVIPFDKRFWLKALLLPTILHRISHVYSIEEFRRRIVWETGLGREVFPVWEPLKVDYTNVNQEEEEKDGISGVKNLEALKSSLPVSKLKDKVQPNRKVIIDPLSERNLYEVGLCDLEFFARSLKEYSPEEMEPQRNEELPNLNAPVPVLGLLSPGGDKSGPDLAQMVQACTSKSTNDIVNYERLEILGDSFLKFAVSLFLFRNYSVNEGILTSLKGKLVGNRNLLYCGLAKNLPDVINVNDFAPLSNWNPPLLRVPERFVEAIVTKKVDPAVLCRLEISTEEQFSGVLSEDTVRTNEDIIDNHEKYYELPSSSLLPYKTVSDKTVSDCLEALIGVYLLTLGLPGAFEFLSWIGVLPAGKDHHSELVQKPYEANVLVPDNDGLVMTLLNEVFYSALEDTLNYRFRNKALLLEALTHPSCFRNRVTDCYQRLEFLGDAVLDFLITLYVYEHLGDLSPGQITDIRSSLVNNVTFACLVVRYGIHKYLLSFSSTLNRSVEDFVSFQINRNHAIDENVAILLEESDCLISESIQVPKALGDIFESLAGAIYLDSGNSLETVWTVYYRLMKREIDEFTKSVPKGSVRLLQEICGEKPYFETKIIGNKTKVTCSVYYENREIQAHGFGSNKQEGKKSACKLVLNKILELKK